MGADEIGVNAVVGEIEGDGALAYGGDDPAIGDRRPSLKVVDVADEVFIRTAGGEDVMHSASEACYGSSGTRRLLVDSLAHAAVFFVGNFEGGGVGREENGEWGISRQDFIVFEKPNVTYPELACARGGFPNAVQFHLPRFGVFPNPEEIVEGNGDEVSGGDGDGVGRGGGLFLDVLDKGDGDGELRDGGWVLAPESLQLLTERSNVASLTLEGETTFASQLNGRRDGCQG